MTGTISFNFTVLHGLNETDWIQSFFIKASTDANVYAYKEVKMVWVEIYVPDFEYVEQ